MRRHGNVRAAAHPTTRATRSPRPSAKPRRQPRGVRRQPGAGRAQARVSAEERRRACWDPSSVRGIRRSAKALQHRFAAGTRPDRQRAPQGTRASEPTPAAHDAPSRPGSPARAAGHRPAPPPAPMRLDTHVVVRGSRSRATTFAAIRASRVNSTMRPLGTTGVRLSRRPPHARSRSWAVESALLDAVIPGRAKRCRRRALLRSTRRP
jgi:hypothetical protein